MDLAPIQRFSAPVGGPLSSTRAEAVGLLCLLQWLHESTLEFAFVTIFIDCLGLLQPGPKDIFHFDVLLPLLRVLREWTSKTVLVKV